MTEGRNIARAGGDGREEGGGSGGDATSFIRTARLIAWTCALTIAVLSLMPGDYRPHTLMPGRAEHFVAYAGTGFFFVLGYLDVRQRALAWLGLALASGIFEILQAFIPGRSSSSLDALASTSGLTFGLAIGLVVEAILLKVQQR